MVVQVYANLEPDTLDVDIGEQYGTQFQKQTNPLSVAPAPLAMGDTFAMQIVINSLGKSLQAFQIEVSFDDTILIVEREESCIPGSDWPDPTTFVCAVNLPDQTDRVIINAQDIFTTASSLQKLRVEIAKIDFLIVGSGMGPNQLGTCTFENQPSCSMAGLCGKKR